MPSERLSRAVVFAFGVAIVVSQSLDLWLTGIDPFSVVLLGVGLAFAVQAVASLGDPDATVLGFEYGIGEEPTWRLAVLSAATVAIVVATVLAAW